MKGKLITMTNNLRGLVLIDYIKDLLEEHGYECNQDSSLEETDYNISAVGTVLWNLCISQLVESDVDSKIAYNLKNPFTVEED